MHDPRPGRRKDHAINKAGRIATERRTLAGSPVDRAPNSNMTLGAT